MRPPLFRPILPLAVMAIAALTFPTPAHPEPPKDAPTNAEARIRIARAKYERLLEDAANHFEAPPIGADGRDEPSHLLDEPGAELFHSWSRRRMEAELEAAADKAGRLAAIRAHRDRMRELETGQALAKLMEPQEPKDGPCRQDEKPPTPNSVLPDPLPDDPEELQDLMVMEPIDVANRRYIYFRVSAKFFRLEAESRLAKAEAE